MRHRSREGGGEREREARGESERGGEGGIKEERKRHKQERGVTEQMRTGTVRSTLLSRV